MKRMISRVIAVAVLAMLAAPAVAQAQSVAVKGGLLYSSFNFDDVDDVIDSRAGWMAGVSLGGGTPNALGLVLELNFLSKRGEISGEGINVDYFQVPILAKLNFGDDGGSVMGYVVAGPNFDFKVSEGGDVLGFDDYEGFDIGLTGGIGVELSKFIIEGRGIWGFRSIAKDLGDANKLKTRSFAILLGYRFN